MARAPQGNKPKLLDRVRETIRIRHYSIRTEEAYVSWIKRYILFHGKRHPLEMGEDEITQFLSALAVDGQVSASTQNQALCALIFLYRHVLGQNFCWLADVVRAKRPQRLPVVLTRPEVRALLGALEGVHWIMASLLYGAGLRLLECLRLRVKDIDFAAIPGELENPVTTALSQLPFRKPPCENTPLTATICGSQEGFCHVHCCP
jgi:integrase